MQNKKSRDVLFVLKMTVERNLEGENDKYHSKDNSLSFQNQVYTRQSVAWFRSLVERK